MWGGDEGGERGWDGVREDSRYHYIMIQLEQLEKKDDSCTYFSSHMKWLHLQVPNRAEDPTPHPHPPPPTTLTTGAPTESAVSFSMVASVIEDNERATPTQLKGEEGETR